jgi:hypothetical protein
MLRKVFSLAGLLAFTALPINGALAQGLPPEDGGFELETEATAPASGFFENISQYVGATLGSNNGTSNAVDKTMSAMSFRVDLPEFKGLKIAAAFDVGAYENTYKLELNNNRRQSLTDCRANVPNPVFDGPDAMTPDEVEYFYENECYYVVNDDGNYLAFEQERVIDDSFAALTEAYLQWEPTSFATLRLGRQPIVLGQFEVFSPLMFTVPMKATGTKTKASRADFSFPQDGLQVSLFPLPQLEVSLLAIPEMRMDDANRQRFEQFAALKGDFVNYAPNQTGTNRLQDIAENDMAMMRIMYFGDRFTLGVTAIDGVEANEDPRREARLVAVPCADYFSGSAPLGSECDNDAFTAYALSDDEGLRFGESDIMAFELAVRVNYKWSLVVEQTIVKSEKELGILPFGAKAGERPRVISGGAPMLDPNDPNFDAYANTVDLTPYFAQLVAENEGKPYINVKTTMQSAGLIYKGQRWLLNLQIAQRIQDGASPREEAWRKNLDYDTYHGEDTEENGTDIIPIVNAVRLLGAEKQGYAGAGFGTFGQNLGFGISAGWRFYERLEIGLFGGMALDVNGADEIEAEGYDTPEGDGYFNLGLNYLF